MISRLALCRVVTESSRSERGGVDGPVVQTLEPNRLSIPHATLLQWMDMISTMFFEPSEITDRRCVRDWDLALSLDGSVENIAGSQADSSGPERVYPVRYRLPSMILNSLGTNEERIQRAELFALGSIFYELISGAQLFRDIGQDEAIHSLITEGEFPEDLWTLPMAPRILACWCPAFAREMLASRGEDTSSRPVLRHVKSPIRFGFQVVGSVAAIASILALPVLGAAGFSAVGPLAGSVAAAWQSGIGVVQVGSMFAWCQSAAMRGAAVGGILATGLAGGGVAVAATVAGALDTQEAGGIPGLKERFLVAWRRETVDQAML